MKEIEISSFDSILLTLKVMYEFHCCVTAVIHWRYMISPVVAIVKPRTATSFQSSNETRVTCDGHV